jgi:hypothetical protein
MEKMLIRILAIEQRLLNRKRSKPKEAPFAGDVVSRAQALARDELT